MSEDQAVEVSGEKNKKKNKKKCVSLPLPGITSSFYRGIGWGSLGGSGLGTL